MTTAPPTSSAAHTDPTGMVTPASAGPGRRRPRTWSLLGDVRRKPTPYEIVTSRFHYHFRRQPAPFEMSPDTPLNLWYLKHREGSPLQVEDWEAFRDPDKLTYQSYVARQADSEVVIDGIVDQYEARDHDASLDPRWVAALAKIYVPSRFALHVMQMSALYLGQMAPSAFITNAAHFQAGDELRRIQWVAYRSKSLSLCHGGNLGESKPAREVWEQHVAWQPAREVLERLLVAYDWGESFVALNLAVKPALDLVLTDTLAEVAEANGDGLLAAIGRELSLDGSRSKRWSAALARFALEADPQVRPLLEGWVQRWSEPAARGAEALAGLLSDAPRPGPAAAEVATKVRDQHQALLAECGL
ncbi:MAG: toluene hydroxylase [Actinomycetota bacterium]|nr:toluene hydroxylase [Actinomycetota bacterium]MDA8076264.1 toluene hydroxylase [Actinomycetota bacterium]